MKCLFWKCCTLALSLCLLLALGALAEGSVGAVSALLCAWGLVYAIRGAWAMAQRAERRAAARPQRAQTRSAAASPAPRDPLRVA